MTGWPVWDICGHQPRMVMSHISRSLTSVMRRWDMWDMSFFCF